LVKIQPLYKRGFSVANGVHLRDVTEDDFRVLHEHQCQPEAIRMAAFPARDWDSLVAHWRKILCDDTVWAKAVIVNGQVAGNIASWLQGEWRLVGYWYGQEHWGKGIATQALTSYIQVFTERPLYAYVATTNIASKRVLEKCGFVECCEREMPPTGALMDGAEEQIFKLGSTVRE